MTFSKAYVIIISAFFVVITSANYKANELEKKFVEAGLINAHAIDKSIKVDFISSGVRGALSDRANWIRSSLSQ